MIPFNKPFAPPIREYEAYVTGIWERGMFTNNGPLVQELELLLRHHLGLEHLLYVSNGTIALQLAIRALELKGEIITTPFSYVATTSSIVWQGCKPVFADIDPKTLNIDPDTITERITPETSAILATHVFGNPCDVEKIGAIARKHNLKVIYDAAHCFGSTWQGRSVFAQGTISITSFHATKLFHTVEGGAVITSDPSLNERLDLMRNFGHDGPEHYNGVGINGKNSELHAAMGLSILAHAGAILSRRKEQAEYYDEILDGMDFYRPHILPGAVSNRAYYPLVFDNETLMHETRTALLDAGINTRRYFYPSLSSLDYTESYDTPVSDRIASSILCLPLFHTLRKEDQAHIARVLQKVRKNQPV